MTAAPPLPAPSPALTVAAVLRSPRLLTREALAGIVTTLALVPEVISFSIVAGVDPLVSLVASIVLCLVMSVLGGRPGVVTAAAGSVALVIAPLVSAHGVEYVLPTVILAGLVQLVFGLAGLARLMRFIPRSVMIGFVNALGVLIFTAQVRHVIGVPWIAYVLFALTLAVVILLPRFTRVVPAPLVAIVLVTAIVIVGHVSVPNVGDEGLLGGGLPGLTRLAVPLDVQTLQIVWPTAISVAFVGLMETLLTAKLVDDLTETPSRKGRESWALGVANIAAGFYGGIAGCAMIGQTILNVKTGGARTRVSTFVAGLFLLALVTGLSAVMAQIPMVALAAVMMIVAITTVDWHSVRPSTLRRMPLPETIVMAVTVIVVVVSNNLALGVLVGVVLAMILFARRVAHVIGVTRQGAGAGDTLRYEVRGPLFFGSSNDLVEHFAYVEDAAIAPAGGVVIDLTHAQIWDASTVAALDSIEAKYRALGVEATFEGLDERSSAFHRRLSGRLSA
ncbi:SulP family inorganic anion transporter [Frondihabitans australicus]|uniref:SulP family sulfate permease n=1 Tax=Frondihabitans australicus TaxID=386892 RepID=A0A495INB4_9MICO|nr:SulP family inorganic anion transporter [Frondihabitans australicus]RKR76636.1 SulP family sulfate permease [Frondihabitans australicus]